MIPADPKVLESIDQAAEANVKAGDWVAIWKPGDIVIKKPKS